MREPLFDEERYQALLKLGLERGYVTEDEVRRALPRGYVRAHGLDLVKHELKATGIHYAETASLNERPMLLGAPQQPINATVGGLVVRIPSDESGGGFCRVRFAFACAKSWEMLESTDEVGVRHCDGCDLNVYLCSSQQEVDEATDQGRCIAVRLPEA